MKIKLLAVLCLLFSIQVYSVNVTIIESKTGNDWAVQDTVWRSIAIKMGYNASIVPQSALDTISNFASTDVLIVSSSNISFATNNHLQTILKFVSSGRPAYIQSEFQSTFQGNKTFEAIMQMVGANFTWLASVSGQLAPMNILGSFATTPNNVKEINYFNYGFSGTGTGVEKFLEFNGSYFGFCYSDPLSKYGTVITISDEDWIWLNKSPLLLGNILYRLANSIPNTTSVKENDPADLKLHVYPNPFSTETNISITGVQHEVTIYVINSNGELVKQISSIPGRTFTLSRDNLPAGLYYIYLESENKTIAAGKLMIIDN